MKIKIWADGDFRDLSDGAQALYFRLITSPTMNLAGVADWRPKRLAALTDGMTAELVEQNAAELSSRGYVITDEDTEEILVRTFVRHDGLIKTPNIAAAMVKDYAGVASATLRGVVVHELHRLRADYPEMSGWSVAKDLLSHPSIDPSSIPSLNPSGMASPNPSVIPSVEGSGMAYPNPSGNASHILKPATLIQQPTSQQPTSSTDVDGEKSSLDSIEFAQFWQTYPRKVGKGDARKSWAKAIKITNAEVITDCLTTALKVQGPMLGASESRFIPHPATWLNQQRWEDEPDPVPAPAPEPKSMWDRVPLI